MPDIMRLHVLTKFLTGLKKILIYSDNALLQSIVLYIILSIFILPYYIYHINPDGISYLSIAQKYMLQDYSNAINGYWGPLLSWLLIPFLAVGFKPLLAFKLLTLLIGLIIIIQTYSLSRIINISTILRNLLLYLIAIIVLYYATNTVTPDILFACISLGFANIILRSSYADKKYMGAICGLIGSGLYLTKSYGFPFFLVTFFIVNILYFFKYKHTEIDKNKRAHILKNFLSGLVVFCMISICWIVLISNKYGHFTIETAGTYNHALVGPQSSGHPMHFMGLIDPPNETAISSWEDISSVKIQSWSYFESMDAVKYTIRKIYLNIINIIYLFDKFSFLAMMIICSAFVYFFQKGKKASSDPIFILMVFIFVNISGYALILAESRYLWLSNIIILIVGTKLLDVLFQSALLKRTAKIFLVAVFSVSFLITPVTSLYADRYIGKNIFDLNNKISDLNIHGRVASAGKWHESLYLSFYNGWHYYGDNSYIPESELISQLDAKKIDYYIIWKSFDTNIKYFEKFKEITDGKIDEFKIYKLK
jgi:hypothetical protein